MASETKGSTLNSATFRRRTTSDRRYRTLLSNLSNIVNKGNARLLFKLFDVPSFTGDIMLGSPDIGSGLFMYIDGQNVISSDDVSYLEKVFMAAKEYGAVRLIREYDNEIHGRPKIQDRTDLRGTRRSSGIHQSWTGNIQTPGEEKMISRKDVSYLVDIFKRLNVEPALNSLERYPRETGQEYGTADTINELPEIQPFTFLLYNLSRCVPKQVIHEIMTRQHIELWITQSKMDHIMHSRNPTIEFIKHLEKRRRITRRDVSLLKTLFKDLLVALVYLNQYETEIQKSKLHEGKYLMSPIGLHIDVEISPYSFLLYNLSRCISKETVEIMIANEATPSDPKLNILQSKSPIIEFVKYLEKVQKILRNDVSYLEAILSSSGLNIASQYVKQYQHEIAHSVQGSHLYCMNRFNREILTDIRRKIGLDRMLRNGLLCLEDVSNATNSTYATRDLNIDNLVTIFFARILSNDLRAFSVFRTFFKKYESQSVVNWFPDFPSSTHANSGISCRDALYAIFLSSDFNVRLMLILKMAACQFAVPILLPYPGDSK
ncbi:hypothetical protein BSL78_13370 [Apostichopus japonicus]|uniref:Up-regulator of cell proliferation-like domain-containing protein n=1 Tax=Stichopus japonicus TaxID=307972 RepID=A0A2G8KP55_STIJA|nr:hypothetical protein BSL78_13370 [Apostichopus japonicus]